MNLENKPKIVFFVKPNLDNFVSDIIDALSHLYRVELVRVTNVSQIEVHMKDADMCWFEWCDDLLIHGSKLPIAKQKKIFCRIHSYEVFTNYVSRVNWQVVDKVIFVGEHIRSYALRTVPAILSSQTLVIPNGIKTEDLAITERKKGFNIAHVGYINFKKGPMLLLHAFKAIHNTDNRYKLYIAGVFQEPRYTLYFEQMIKELNLEGSVILSGWQTDIDQWLEDKQYILSSSVLESQHLSMMEAMAKGIKPLVHNFVGARSIYPEEHIWSSIDELVEMVQEDEYDSYRYRHFIEVNYQFDMQLTKITELIEQAIVQKDIFTVFYKGQQSKLYLPNLNDHIQKIIAHYQSFYEIEMLEDIVKRVEKNSVMIDVGAYIGNHSIFFAQYCEALVYAFEPNHTAFELLEKNIQLNGLEKKVSIKNIGIGKGKARATIENQIANNLGMSQLKSNSKGDIEIESFDDLFKDIPKIDVIKIDVEGMELEVLQGAANIITKHKPVLYIETATRDQFNHISNHLKKFGYQSEKQFNATPTTLFLPDTYS